jgi:hypothetical protein
MFPALVGLMVLVNAACSGGDGNSDESGDASPITVPVSEPTRGPSPQAAAEPASTPVPTDTPTALAAPDELKGEPATPEATPTASPRDDRDPDTLEEMAFLYHTQRGWKTDFSKMSVVISELIPGGPPRDGIPPIDEPKLVPVPDAPTYMMDDAPVISVEIGGEAKAYPLAILMRHEIVNDEVGGVPVTVTFCPLCNTSIVFDRRVDGKVLDFGTSGNLRNSNLIMWDRQTESWWEQVTGEAIVGEMTGTRLEFLPAPVISWGVFRDAFPEGQLLSRDQGFYSDYSTPPYFGYDAADNTPFLFFGNVDPRLPAMERVVSVTIDGVSVAYPFLLLRDRPAINDSVNGRELAVFYVGGTFSPFVGLGTDPTRVGSSGIFDPFVDGRKLTFTFQDGAIKDDETGSTWNILGQAIEGPMKGSRLESVVHGNHFWFSWAASFPDTAVRTAADIGG